MQNVVGPTFVAMATTFALVDVESNRLPACQKWLPVNARFLQQTAIYYFNCNKKLQVTRKSTNCINVMQIKCDLKMLK